MRVLLRQKIVAISKPRCGSTSVRRMIDPFIDRSAGDISVDTAEQHPPYHPHMTAPYLQELMAADGIDIRKFDFFVTIRNPIEMLWSYYKFFQPDAYSNYNYQKTWMSADPMPFERWVVNGRLGSNPSWLKYGPKWISQKNLSPLSLEAHVDNSYGISCVQYIFQVEEMYNLAEWLSSRLGKEITSKKVNRSIDVDMPNLGTEAKDQIKQCFPKESDIYSV